jgi:hypothetical protein
LVTLQGHKEQNKLYGGGEMIKKVSLLLGLMAMFVIFPAVGQAQTKQLMISGYAFHAMDYDAEFTMGGGVIYSLVTTTHTWFAAPVYLPQGAKITKIEVRASNNGAASFTVGLWRRNVYSNVEQQMAVVTVTNTGGAWQSFTDSTVSYWQVNNSGYGYYVCINFGSAKGPNYMLEGVKIDYLQ